MVLQESPLYKIGADPVYFLTDEQVVDLDRIFQSMLKEFNSQYVHKYDLLKTKALIVHTDWNISQIAYSLGYESPNYFNNFFKKQTGITPRELR